MSDPEYIDDDEYYDPDDDETLNYGAGTRSSHILGSSGTNSGRVADAGRSSYGAGKKAARRQRPAGGQRQAPAARSSPSESPPPKSRRTRAAQAVRGVGGRLGGLRTRLGRGDAGKSSSRRQPARSESRFRNPDRSKTAQQSTLGARRANPKQAGRTKPRGAGRTARAQQRPAAQNTARASKAPTLEADSWLDLDRKLDLLGIGLVFAAIVLFFSALSQEQAAISAIHNFIGQLFGWGALAVPVTMFAVGVWLIIRHFGDSAPTIDPVRLSGAVTVFVCVLVFFQYVDSFRYAEVIPDAMQAQRAECDSRTSGLDGCAREVDRLQECQIAFTAGCVQELVQHSYQNGRGGGYAGGWLYLTLLDNFTEIGGFFIVMMVLTFGVMMLTRLSLAEIALALLGIGRSFRTAMARRAAARRAQRLQAEQQVLEAEKAAVHVSKPAAAQLPAAEAVKALPRPADDIVMPLPRTRTAGLRSLFRRQSQDDAAESDAEALPAVPEPAAKSNRSLLGRVFGRSRDRQGESGADEKPRAAANAGGSPHSRRAAQPKPAPFVTPRTARPASLPNTAAPRPVASSAGGGVRPLPPLSDGTLDSPARPAASSAGVAARPADERNGAPRRADGDDADSSAAQSRSSAPAAEKPSASPKKPLAARPRSGWVLPDYRDLLELGSDGGSNEAVLRQQAQKIEETLAGFGAPGRVVEVNPGPVITQFGIEPDYLTLRSGKKNRVKVSAIAQLDKDLQLALGAKSIRVEAPVPGKGYVGIEVPNPNPARVSLRDVMESPGFREVESPLAIALGMSVDGAPISADLTQMPHLLIAGTTGSGKSKCINAIISSIIATNSPEDVKFIMVDPKRVELTGYNGLPHLIGPVVVEPERIVGVLKWVTREMDARYKKFSSVGSRNIADYNRRLAEGQGGQAPMPYIVVIIDELADLMMLAPEETERAITRIAAMARATGIHLVIATQRPSIDVVTGLIKANFRARIAFAVAGSVDSRVILDQPGAEQLLGKGDMLYLSGSSSVPLRLQGVFVSDAEIDRINHYWQAESLGIQAVEPIRLPAESPPPESAAAPGKAAQAAFWDMDEMAAEGGAAGSDEDELYPAAVELVRRLEKASISLLQRRLRIGYTRAARLIDLLEERGVIGPSKEGSSKPRDVLPE